VFLRVYNQPVSPIIQQAVYLFMKRGHFAGHIRKMRRIYQAKHRALIGAIRQEMGERVEIIGYNSGLHLLLDVIHRDSDQLIEQAMQVGVRVYSPRIHWLQQEQCPRSYVMVGFGGMSEEEIVEGVRSLSVAWFS
jgi:GntR family transcriptional regulator/MocR family aminotransferase